METTSLTRRYRFAAAHRLHTDCLTDQENRTIFGKCNNPNGHGHNYVLLVTVRGTIDPETGRVTDMGILDRTVQETVLARFDHRDLNQDPAFSAKTTTGENLVLFIWDLLVDKLPAGCLEKIGIIETRDNYFEYAGSAERLPAGRTTERG